MINRLSFLIDTKKEEVIFSPNNDVKEIIIEKVNVEILSETEYAWRGIIQDNITKDKIGDATLIVNSQGNVTGNIDVEGVFFEIQPLGNSKKHILVSIGTDYIEEIYKDKKNDIQNISGKSKSSYNLNSTTTSSNSTSAGPRCYPNYQRVLAVYTANAASGRDMNGIINLAIQNANDSYLNSGVTNMRLALAHKQQISFSETTNMANDLDVIVQNSVIANLRNQYDADVVVLLTDGNYGGALGRATQILATDAVSYAIVESDFANGPDYVFAHEVGHLQGAQHAPEDPIDPNGPFSYGFGHKFSYKPSIFVDRRRRSTVMAYPWTFGSQYTWTSVKHFSNPNITYNGAATGVINSKENFQVLINTAPTLADFRNPNELNSRITYTGGPSSYTFTADPCGGGSQIDYEWRIADDPFAGYGPILSTNSVFSPALNDGNWYIQLKTTSNGNSVFSYSSVYVYGGEECEPFTPCPILYKNPNGTDPTFGPPTEFKLLPAYPNPFNPTTQLSFSIPEAQNINLSVYDLSGRKVAEISNEVKEVGNYTVSFDASSLSSGVYFVRLQGASTIQTHQITLIK